MADNPCTCVREPRASHGVPGDAAAGQRHRYRRGEPCKRDQRGETRPAGYIIALRPNFAKEKRCEGSFADIHEGERDSRAWAEPEDCGRDGAENKHDYGGHRP